MGAESTPATPAKSSSIPLVAQSLPSALLAAPKVPRYYAVEVVKGVQVPDPRFVRSLLALMNQGAVNGGAACHWGGPAAMIEIWSVLHATFYSCGEKWFEEFNFVNDIGHGENGLYALKAAWGFKGLELSELKSFRKFGSRLTGHGESHLFPEGVLLSNGPLASALPQAQGLAMGDALAKRKRTTVVTLSDGAAMEGEAKEAFAAIPGLAQKGKLAPFVLFISDNNTKLGGRIDQDAFSMAPTFATLETLGWHVLKCENAYDFSAIQAVWQQAQAESQNHPQRPVAVWCKTVKGQGLKSCTTSTSGGHGYPLKAYDPQLLDVLKELWAPGAVPAELLAWAQECLQKPSVTTSAAKTVVKDKIQIGVTKGLIRAAQAGYPIVSLSSDLAGSTGVKGFQNEFKERTFDVGVAEANMVSAAAGMSKVGFIPVVDTFAAFGVTKGNLPLIMASLSQAPVMAFFSHTGFQDAADGASHQSLTYLSALASIPHLKMVNLATAKEAEEFVFQATEKMAKDKAAGKPTDSVVFFLGRENFPLETTSSLGPLTYKWLSPQLIETGKDGVIVSSGSLLEEALKARELLAREGLAVSVVNHPFVNAVDGKFFRDLFQTVTPKIVTLEDHQVKGGMGSLLIHELIQNAATLLSGKNLKAYSCGVKGEFGQSSYTSQDLYQKHGLDAAGVAQAFRDLK